MKKLFLKLFGWCKCCKPKKDPLDSNGWDKIKEGLEDIEEGIEEIVDDLIDDFTEGSNPRLPQLRITNHPQVWKIFLNLQNS